MTTEYTISDIQDHVKKEDLFIVVHGKVYNATTFLDEHPGGEEVIIDVAGSDASEAFEDVGHSDEAREQLEKLLIGTLKVDPNAPVATQEKSTVKTASLQPSSASSMGLMVVLVAMLAFGVYRFAL